MKAQAEKSDQARASAEQVLAAAERRLRELESELARLRRGG